jgi:hypothetical protein
MAFSQLGFSLPDLTITGSAGPRAAWGGTLDVSVYLQNIGASTTTEPLSQAPPTQPPITGSPYGSVSTADAPDSSIAVLLSPTARSLKGSIKLGTIVAAPISQNSVENLVAAFTLPARPAGFTGGKFFVRFLANSTNAFPEVSTANNLSKPFKVMVTPQPLPELQAIALDVPNSLHPGDTIVPEIQIENFGTANPNIQGPVTVDLVASVTPSFTLGSSIVATYTVNSIPPVSQQPTNGNFLTFAQQIVGTPNNVVTIVGQAVTLPTSPAKYFLGVVIDPQGQIKQLTAARKVGPQARIHKVASQSSNNFSLIHVVGPGTGGLPPAGVVSTANQNAFPDPPSGQFIGIGAFPTPTPTPTPTPSIRASQAR